MAGPMQTEKPTNPLMVAIHVHAAMDKPFVLKWLVQIITKFSNIDI